MRRKDGWQRTPESHRRESERADSDRAASAGWHPAPKTLLWIAAVGLALYSILSVVVALGHLDAADLRLHVWIVHNVGTSFLGIPWATWTATGATTLSVTAVGLAAFFAWRAQAVGTAVIIVAFSLAGGLLVDGLKGIHERPYPQHAPHFLMVGDDGGACPEHGRCDIVIDEDSAVYCPPSSRCNFYSFEPDREGFAERNGTLEERNSTRLPVDYSTFPTRQGRAYPSGHTMGATLSWGLAILLGTRAVQGRRGLDPWALGAWGIVAVMGGISRMPLYTHWWTDVVASWLLGVALLALAVLVDDRLRPLGERDLAHDPAALPRVRL